MAKAKSKNPSSAAYALDRRDEKNKIRKIKRHLKAFPNDKQAAKSLAKIETSGHPHRKTPKSKLYPITRIIRGKVGSEEKVSIIKVSRNHAIELRKAKAAINQSKTDKLYFVPTKDRMMYKAKEESRKNYSLGGDTIALLQALKGTVPIAPSNRSKKRFKVAA